MAMTEQQIFDTAASHLLQQGAKSVTSIGCAYRGENQTSCAIGCMIPDDLYDQEMEGKTIASLARKFPDTITQLFGEDALASDSNKKALLMRLQNVHDRLSTAHWHEALADVAQRFGLATTVLET